MATDRGDGTLRTILVPIDGSDGAAAALDLALSLADGTEATVHVLAVVDVTDAPLWFDAALVSDLERAKDRLVGEVVATYDDHDAHVTGAVRRGRPARTIVDYADEQAIDLIVLGRSGRSGIAPPLLGSTADRVVRTATTSVLVVPDEVAGGEE
ncbi:universal stress protein [Natrialbaceae archaeon GCM10025810]|uniref:universal stress protein n=1 Tax=Halovalidus salilacus TaxID=3075124 RepID=UPI00360601EC